MSAALVADLRLLLARRSAELGVPGVAVGIVDGDASTVVAHGHPSVGDPRAVDQ